MVHNKRKITLVSHLWFDDGLRFITHQVNSTKHQCLNTSVILQVYQIAAKHGSYIKWFEAGIARNIREKRDLKPVRVR